LRFSVHLSGVPGAGRDETRLLSPKEVAERCSVSASSVLSAIKRGELRAARLGRLYRIPEPAVDEWIESRMVPPPEPSVMPFGSLPEPVRLPARSAAGTQARLLALERGVKP
jgi:excisionase family DNA binding protein